MLMEGEVCGSKIKQCQGDGMDKQTEKKIITCRQENKQ